MAAFIASDLGHTIIGGLAILALGIFILVARGRKDDGPGSPE